MEQLIEAIVKPLVDFPENVLIERIEEEKSVTYRLKVHEKDIGKVIGKQGRVAKAIRTVVYAHAQTKRGILLKILTTITVKQILTEKSKIELYERFTKRKEELKRELDQLKFEMKRMEKSKKYSSLMLQHYYEKEMNDRHEKIKILDFQLEQLNLLPIGTELKEREVQGLVEVEVGDTWNEVMNGKTIIVKDGIIQEIKEG